MEAGDSRCRTVAVSDGNQIFVRGLQECLREGGLNLVDVGHPPNRDAIADSGVALVSPDRVTIEECVADLAGAGSPATVVGLLSSTDPLIYVETLKSGAVAAVWRGSAPDRIECVLRLALEGHSVLPAAVVRILAAHRPTAIAPCLQGQDQVVLRYLATGETVRSIARQSGYSERAMHRRLRTLYKCIGARNRAEAIALAARWGILDPRLDVEVDLRETLFAED